MGGVVPEAAARAHVKNILPVVNKTINDSQLTINDLDYIAVTQGPGLMPSLIVGVEFAKAFSFAAAIPILPINHMLGHLYSPFRDVKDQGSTIKNLFPIISLIVSGGHTMLVLMHDLYKYEVLGQKVDDATGEAFDKVAKLLGLPYPGGPEVSKLAALAKNPVEFPRPMIHSKDYNFSFSGLKTAVLYYVKDQGSRISAGGGSASGGKDTNVVADICAGFQNAAVDVLVTKTLRAAKEYKAKSISVSGGVSANLALQTALQVRSSALGLNFFVPEKDLRTDNAEMIGLAAAVNLQNNIKPMSPIHLAANANFEL